MKLITYCNISYIWWALAELNCGHEAFQASALPTELRAHGLYAENGSSAASEQNI